MLKTFWILACDQRASLPFIASVTLHYKIIVEIICDGYLTVYLVIKPHCAVILLNTAEYCALHILPPKSGKVCFNIFSNDEQ